jgi:pimeloyl-ACP methyl ester carboxylesterase
MDSEISKLQHSSSYCSIAGVQVRYVREGSGPVIVLLHGSGSSLDAFDAVARRLRERCEVVRIDLPGFGLTGPRPDRDYRIGAYTRFLDELLGQLGIGSAVLVGNSLGGNIAWQYALDFPDRVRGLVLVNATGYPEKSLPDAIRLARNPVIGQLLRRWGPRSAVARSLRQAAGRTEVVDDELIDRAHAMASRPGNRGAFVDFANTEQVDRSPEVSRLAVPTLVVRGDLIDGQHFARDIARSRELVLPGVGHLLPEEAPEELADAILSFVDAELPG